MKKLVSAILLSVVMLAATMYFVPAGYAETISDGLVAHYTFDGNLNDSSPTGNNGIQMGNISFVKGISGNAASFDGKSYIEVNPGSSLNLANEMTVSVWVYKKYDHLAGLIPIVQKEKTFNLCDYQMYPRLMLYNDSGDYEKLECTEYVDINKWELITVTYGSDGATIYVNGVKNENMGYSGALPIADGKLIIGKMFDSEHDVFFKGNLDDLRIYNKTLDPNQVQSLYTEMAAGAGKDLVSPPKKLVAWYKFNGDTKDSSGFANDAKYVGPGSPAYTDSIQGKGLVFNGSTYLEVADNYPQQLDKAFTVSAWVCEEPKSDINDDAYPILAKANCSLSPEIPAYQFQYRHLSGNNERIRFYGIDMGTSSPNNEIEQDFGSAYKVWKMITVTNDGQKTTAYVNGKQAGDPSDFTAPLLHSGGKLFIGRSAFRDEGNVVFKGTMDEVRIYNYALSAEEVKGKLQQDTVTKIYNYRDTIVMSASAAAINALKAGSKTLKFKVNLVPPEKTPVTDITARVKYTPSNPSVFTAANGVLTITGKPKANEKLTLTLTLGPNSTTIPLTIK